MVLLESMVYPFCVFEPVKLFPQVDRFLDHRRGIRPVDLAPFARGLVGSVHDLQHFAAVFAGFHAGVLAQHAVDEVLHLLREAVVPDLLEHGEGVALGRPGLFDGVAVAFLE